MMRKREKKTIVFALQSEMSFTIMLLVFAAYFSFALKRKSTSERFPVAFVKTKWTWQAGEERLVATDPV